MFAELAEHSEVTLSRREIIKFILSEAAKRSRDVQTLLKLDAIDEIRATLKTTENKLGAEQTTAKTVAESAEDSLKRHLDLAGLKAEEVLAAVNKRRRILGLPLLDELIKDTDVSQGIGQGAAEAGAARTRSRRLWTWPQSFSSLTRVLKRPRRLRLGATEGLRSDRGGPRPAE